MRIQRELILLFSRDAIFLRNMLAGDAHVVVVVNVPKTIVHHGIDDLCVAQTISFARVRQKVWCVCHRFHSASYNNRTVAGLDGLRAQSNRFQSGTANLVDGHGTHFRRQSTENRSLSRWILPQPC